MAVENDDPLPLVEDGDTGHRFLIYATEAGVRVDLQVDNGTFWASQAQMAAAFGVTRPNITIHLQNIFREGELSESSVCKESYALVRMARPIGQRFTTSTP